ncbi:glycosyltransferase family 2 protein [Chryseobacterium koreense]|uniref:glycosyltransferase family 2 protein n=1 Tax=Chryseobacterium koreense TaxID=232216 RepID=UPI0026F1B447|nr:glycosyltransferase family 2 protein [Chryseobacterium koreense]
MNTPLISVIVPCYNHAEFLEECLQSVLCQIYENWECIIVNDGSIDNTEEIANKWTEKDPRFKYVEKENGGLSSARNAGMKRATGDYIQFLDADDTLHSEKFKKSKSHIDTENAELIVSQFNILKNDTFTEGYNFIKPEYLRFESVVYDWSIKFTIPIHTALISKKLLNDFLFDESLSSCEDWPMWIHILKNHPKCTVIDEPLANYRKENSKKNMSDDLQKIVEQRNKIMPQIKALYGEKLHDDLAYHLIKVKSLENINLKKELQKITSGRIVGNYLKLKKFYYKHIKKN